MESRGPRVGQWWDKTAVVAAACRMQRRHVEGGMVAGRHAMGQWHTTGQGASDRLGWLVRVQVVCSSGDM